MEPGRAALQRRERALSKKERLDAEDLEVCGRVGEEFALGPVESVSRTMEDPSGLSSIGCVSLLLSVVVGLPVTISIAASSASPSTKIVIAAVFGGMLVLGWPVAALGTRYQVVGSRTAVHTGGVARLSRKEPEPRVLRWADVDAVTIALTTDEGTPETGIASCTLRGPGGTDITERKDGEAVALAAHRALGPRFVPPLIEAYDSGKPAMAGDAFIDREGFTMKTGKRLAWSEIKSVTMRHASEGSAEVATRIDVRLVRKNRLHYFNPTTVPNAIFLAHVLARAAARNGVQVDGYREAGR